MAGNVQEVEPEKNNAVFDKLVEGVVGQGRKMPEHFYFCRVQVKAVNNLVAVVQVVDGVVGNVIPRGAGGVTPTSSVQSIPR